MLINGRPGDSVAAQDRGLAYGDGVFRTLQLRRGRPLLWRWQYARLADDARRLSLPVPDEALLLEELLRVGGELRQAVAKITLTRGVGARGFAMPQEAETTRIVAAAPWAGYPPACAEDGVAARWCRTRLAIQPRLAGIKHLNRLENVLARSEWDDPAIREGLLLDMQGNLVEGTMSNVYLLRGREVHTPRLDQCGVNGAVRDWLTDKVSDIGLSMSEMRLSPEALVDADAVFLSNSLIGIWPLARLGERVWQPSPALRQLQRALLQQA